MGQVAQTNDGVFGIIFTAPAADSLAVGTPALITSLEDAADLGIDAAYDTANSVSVYKHLKEFYDEAGAGASLYIMLLSQALSLQDVTTKTNLTYAPALLDYAQGKISVLGVVRNPSGGYSPTVTNGIDVDTENAITTAQALAEEYFAKFRPIRVILPARHYNGTVGDLPDLKATGKNRVGVLLGDTASGTNAAIGLLLGRAAKIPVQRNIGRVKDGSLAITTAYIGTDTVEDAQGDWATIHTQGFISLRRYDDKAGYYFTNDIMATADTDDYNRLNRGRVIDKATRLAYATYINELLDDVPVDENTGRLPAALVKYYQQQITNQIGTSMQANGEISGLEVIIDPAQNILSTGELCVELRIIPVGSIDKIVIKLGFSNPALNS